MKVLLLTTHLHFGGIGAYTISLAKQLKKMGDVPIVASSGGDLVSLLEKEDICHFSIPLNTKSELSPKICLVVFKLISLLQRQKIDIIHAQTRVSQVSAYFLSKLTGIPFISTCHGFFKPNIGRRIFPCWGKAVIAISEAVREHLVNDFGVDKKKVHLIHNGVEIEKFKMDKSPEQIKKFKQKIHIDKTPFVIGIIGRLSEVKGHRYLLMAAKEIVQFNSGVKFLIIGDGAEKKHLLQLVKKLNIEKQVVFLKPIFDTSLALKCMDVFVMPSIQEGLGLSILEAMASGLPIIASNVGGIYTLVKDGVNGFLVSSRNPSAISVAIHKFLKDPSLLKKMGREGQRMAQEYFSLNKMASQTRSLYAQILSP
jgi:glycosyltransferase involved in cell wall biosynthesis